MQESDDFLENNEEDCKCIHIEGNLHLVKWPLYPRVYSPSPGYLAIADFTEDPYIWLHYIDDSQADFPNDDVLKSTDTKYWSLNDVQRYFVGDLHCERILFSYQYPNFRMPTEFGSHLWKSNTALKLHNKIYTKELGISIEHTLKKIAHEKIQVNRLILSDQLINIDRMDYFKRKTFFKILMDIMSFQNNLQLVSLENLSCRRLEGVRLIQQLACFNADSLKYLFLWRFTLTNENPILVNYSYITGSGQYIPRPPSKQCFLRSLCALRNLRVLALEYSHLADCTGGAILALLPLLKKSHFWLQLICREDQIPDRGDPSLGIGGHGIPDNAWRILATACPDIYLSMHFFRIRHYDDLRRFLTPSVPLRQVHLEHGVDLLESQRQDSDLSCLFRHLAYRYANTLVAVSLHQWRFVTFPLRRVFELMPWLVRFHYVGRVEDEVDLHRMMRMIASGVCIRLKTLRIQIQDQGRDRDYWNKCVSNIITEYNDIMSFYNIDFCLSIYKN